MRPQRILAGASVCTLTGTLATLFFAGPASPAPYQELITCDGTGGFGYSVAVGDVDGDGHDDTVVGARGSGPGTEGQVLVFFGGPAADDTADLTLTGQGYDAQFGTALAVGDVNGDGFSDILVGSMYYAVAGDDHKGRAYVYFGGSALDATADVVMTGTLNDGLLGSSIATAGDVDGDGYGDMIVGARYFHQDKPGSAFLYLGGPTLDNVADLVLTDGQNGDDFGNDVAGVGDVNGDGYDDLLVSARLDDSAAENAGRAYVYLGSSSPDAVADLVLDGEALGDYFGMGLGGVGDVNDDGYDDFVVSATRHDAVATNAGRVYLHLGAATLDAVADVILDGEGEGDYFGGKSGFYTTGGRPGFGDLDGDGFSDFILGAGGHDHPSGRVYVHLGAATPNAVADVVIDGDPLYPLFGTAHAVGDVSGDGLPDLVVGTALADPSRVYSFTFSPVSADPSGICISTVHTCVTVPVDFEPIGTRDIRGASVTLALSPELELCGSITQGSWLSGFDASWQVLNLGGGVYRVDQTILGSPCGISTGGTLFELPLQKAAGVTTDAVGTVTVTKVTTRDCFNQPVQGSPGAVASVLIDITVPDAVADIAATQKKSGNGSDGTTEVTLNFSVPVDADETFVYRKGYGDYPEYDDGTGTLPTLPPTPGHAAMEGWTLTTVTATGEADEPATRDYWYYVVFTEDACDNVSAVSNLTTGTLNYHLGDVTDGTNPGDGDNEVDLVDLTLLGANYGNTVPYGGGVNYLDIGPTDDWTVNTLPKTDDMLDFEDLMVLSMNYGDVTRAIPVVATLDRPALGLQSRREGEYLKTRLMLKNHAASVKGIHALVGFDRSKLELVSCISGELLQTGSPVFLETLDDAAGCFVDLAVLGVSRVLEGSGEVAELTFRVRERGTRPHVVSVDSRGPMNERLGDLVAHGDPAVTITTPSSAGSLELFGAQPNPFTNGTEIAFNLPDRRPVTVSIFDVSGRLVRTIADGSLPMGRHTAVWDGRDASGQATGAGIYFYTFQAGEHRETRKLLHVR